MSREFRQAAGKFPTGVTVTTTLREGGEPVGVTLSSFASLSLTPPLILVCIQHSCRRLAEFRASSCFAVNVLAAGQQELSILFARGGDDQFSLVGWQPGKLGMPLLSGALATFECAVESVVAAGDHDILIGRVISQISREGEPLVYVCGSYRQLAEAAQLQPGPVARAVAV